MNQRQIRDLGVIMAEAHKYNAQAPWVKAIRSRLNLTQATLAEKCGVSPRTVENWEQGRTRISGSARKILEGL